MPESVEGMVALKAKTLIQMQHPDPLRQAPAGCITRSGLLIPL